MTINTSDNSCAIPVIDEKISSPNGFEYPLYELNTNPNLFPQNYENIQYIMPFYDDAIVDSTTIDNSNQSRKSYCLSALAVIAIFLLLMVLLRTFV